MDEAGGPLAELIELHPSGPPLVCVHCQTTNANHLVCCAGCGAPLAPGSRAVDLEHARFARDGSSSN